MEKKKTNNLAVCIICGILTAFGIVASVVSLVNGSNEHWKINDLIYLALTVLIGYYAAIGYRRPHGNLFKQIILIYVASYLILVYQLAQTGDAWQAVIRAITIGIICYVAGRLHRVKQNFILIGIVTAIIMYIIVSAFIKQIAKADILSMLIIWIDICVAYFLRYKEHKEAGLMDKAEN